MKKWGLVLMMIVLLSGCGVKSEAALETVTDGLEMEPPAPYCIVFSVPEGMTQETFGDDGRCAVYEAENGDYTITTEILDATTVEGAAEQISGIPAERLDILTLAGNPMKEHHFAWSSTGEERETVSRCALMESADYYYVLTMTERTGLGGSLDETADAVFSSFCLTSEEMI